MVNAQYTIPEGSIRREVDEIFAAREHEQAYEPYAVVTESEAELVGLRAGATEANVPKPGIFNSLGQLISIKSPRSLEEKLVNAEAEIGGAVLPKPEGVQSQRFFFYGGYWYLEQHDKQGQMIACYQFTKDKAFKIVGGREVPFAPGEAENVVGWIPVVMAELRGQMYQKERIDGVVKAEAETFDLEYEALTSEPTDPIDAELDALLAAKNIAQAIEEQKSKDDFRLAA